MAEHHCCKVAVFGVMLFAGIECSRLSANCHSPLLKGGDCCVCRLLRSRGGCKILDRSPITTDTVLECDFSFGRTQHPRRRDCYKCCSSLTCFQLRPRLMEGSLQDLACSLQIPRCDAGISNKTNMNAVEDFHVSREGPGDAILGSTVQDQVHSMK